MLPIHRTMQRELLLVLALLAAACSSGPTFGERGVASLGYVDGWQLCQEHCSLAHPLALGGAALVWSPEATSNGIELRSMNPGIVRARSVGSRDHFLVEGVAEGSARLEMVDRDDELIDAFTVEVREATEVQLVEGAQLESPNAITTTHQPLRFALYRDGVLLRGFGALTYTLSDNLRLDRFDAGDRVDPIVRVDLGERRALNSELIEVWGDQSGAVGALEVATSAGAQISVPFEATAPTVESVALTSARDDFAEDVFAGLLPDQTDEGLRACCEWELDQDGEVLILTRLECRSVRVVSTGDGPTGGGLVRCEARGMEAEIEVFRPPGE